jgi:hypothetical protein
MLTCLSSYAIAQRDISTVASVKASGSDVTRTLDERAADVVNVKDFGAKGDGITDDAAAINAAIGYLRIARTIGGEIAGRLVFPQGRYVVNSTINLTSIRSRYTEIDGGGAVLIGKTPGKPVVDALGTRYLRIRDLSIEGDATRVPTIGIQIGRTDTTARDSSDNITLDAVFVTGSFSFAALYNLNAETSMFARIDLWNNYISADSYALVQDGMNHWKAHSDFVTEKAPIDTPQSFNENLFLNADIRHFGGGTPIWMAQTSRHQFINSYAANTKGQHAVILYSVTNTDQNLMLDLDLHVETSSIVDSVFLTGPNTTPILTGLQLRDHYSFASNSLLKADVGILSVSMPAARFEIGGFYSPSARVFAQPALWSGSADVTLESPSYWNGTSAISTILTYGSTKSLTLTGGVLTNTLRVTASPPASSSASCVVGQISADADYIYVCTKTNEWKRAPLNRW